MDARAIITKKRDGAILSDEEVQWFARGLADNSISDAQVGAFAMAVLLQGMVESERVALTLAMRDSGDVQQWDLSGPILDKHSTGGVGDNVSLMLAPALAACGAFVPMISGRGLGHTGGTLDKFDAIPGYNCNADPELLHRVVSTVGCAIVGPSANIAPADGRLYAVRDVTGTVESLDLITASILSKKLAAGLDALVLDVKWGSGAFNETPEIAEDLAKALTSVANGAGCKTTALITDMNEPLASAMGNAIEVANAVDFLRGDVIDSRLWDVTVALGGAVLVSGGLAETTLSGEEMVRDVLQSGAAAEKFAMMVAALGGPNDFLENARNYMSKPSNMGEIFAPGDGFITAINGRALGLAVIGLGGGRKVASDKLDYATGFDQIAGLGTYVEKGAPIARVHASSLDDLDVAKAAFLQAYTFGEHPSEEREIILKRID